VEYRAIRYTVRARIERGEWTVSIHPADIEIMIDKWYQARGANRREASKGDDA